jgi:hypothetical protein
MQGHRRARGAFLERPLEGEWPDLWLDATYLKVRDGGRIVSVAAIIAVAVDTDGRRAIIGLGLGPSEAETFWSTFLKGLVRRGLKVSIRCGPPCDEPPAEADDEPAAGLAAASRLASVWQAAWHDSGSS